VIALNIFGVGFQSDILRIVNSLWEIQIPEIANGIVWLENVIVCIEMVIFTLLTN